MKILLVTNDFPPRVGGIQTYLWNLYRRLAERGDDVRVLAPAFSGDAAFDFAAPVEVLRWPGSLMWPRAGVERRVRELSRDRDLVVFGAVVPMNVIALRLDRPLVVHTHGFEVAWARLPALSGRLRAIARASSLVTVVSDFTRALIERAVGADVNVRLLKTGVALERFHPGIDSSGVRSRYRLGDGPLIVCVSRLVARKGQDQLLRAFPAVRASVPGARLLIVGRGPARRRLERLARHAGVEDATVFAGEVPEEQLPEHYAAGDVFAMPCRSRYAGLEVEGLGLVYLEAQACGRPAIAGDSGGAPESVVPGRTGLVVGGRDTRALTDALVGLLSDPRRAQAMGEAGRRFVEAEHSWEEVAARYRTMLASLDT